MRVYRNQVQELVDNYLHDFNITIVPIEQNQQPDFLASVASIFKPSKEPPKLKYEVEMRYIPSIKDNVKHFQVFQDDQHIEYLLN